jgi:glycosyltransferase involved in cell wall biosynthesis
VPDASLLILIPAYNEESRIEPTLRNYAEFFAAHYTGEVRLVVVLNGCRDNTLGVVQRVAGDFPNLSYLDFKAPIGKGGALIEGLKLSAYGDYVGYVDADGATPPAALLTLVRRMGEADCVIGSRWLPGAVLLQSQTKLRRLISRVFHSVVEMLFWMHIADTQCPCKLIKRSAVEKIHTSLRIADLAFDVNLLVSLKRAGLTVLEVPIEWRDMVGSKVTSSLFRSALTMLLSVVRLRLIYSPVYQWLRPLRPLEAWVYTSLLRQPQPLPGPDGPAVESKKTE